MFCPQSKLLIVISSRNTYQVDTPRMLRLHPGVVMKVLQRTQHYVVHPKRGAGPKAVTVLHIF